ncbi:hypothetical protein ACNSPR_29200 [Klebsiella pneumoniae]
MTMITHSKAPEQMTAKELSEAIRQHREATKKLLEEVRARREADKSNTESADGKGT